MTQRKTGSLSQVRWYGQNVVLPTGEVVVFSGGDKDEVVLPGTEFPVQQAELFDPAKSQWRAIATAHNPRTYHNTAVLLPSGEVLVGGHATISRSVVLPIIRRQGRTVTVRSMPGGNVAPPGP